MSIRERLERLGEIEIPLSTVIVVVALAVIVVNQQQKEIHYVVIGGPLAEKTGVIIETNQSFKEKT